MPANESSSALVLGIDTGGTYTDGVLLEYQSRRVLATHKSLTTKRDLSIGIERVIDGIHIEDPSAIKMVSISTTLATNAIAEGKGKRVALLLIGYDPELIASFKLSAHLPRRTTTTLPAATTSTGAKKSRWTCPPCWPRSARSRRRWTRWPCRATSAR